MHLRTSLTRAMLCILIFGACERQGPPPKPVGSATNKHVEEKSVVPSSLDADALIQNMKTPMDKARQTEEQLKRAADRTQEQPEPN